MRPYLIINGVNSMDVKGLLIQSLPPIVAPKMRTKSEEISGRDGDIVTTLGYKAYDKSIKIGLYGDYNVDEIIKYFSQSGEIIFSNEEDKYYNFACYESISLDRLLRFKQGTIKLHVQPYKYDVYEKIIDWDNDNDKGLLLTLNNKGNTTSRPVYEVTGSGTLMFRLNGKQILVANANPKIILDTTTYNAKNGNGVYINRQVTGDVKKLCLPPGESILNIRGNVDNVKIKNVSRWL
jgi:predicted phage tail component-like protein